MYSIISLQLEAPRYWIHEEAPWEGLTLLLIASIMSVPWVCEWMCLRVWIFQAREFQTEEKGSFPIAWIIFWNRLKYSSRLKLTPGPKSYSSGQNPFLKNPPPPRVTTSSQKKISFVKPNISRVYYVGTNKKYIYILWISSHLPSFSLASFPS